MFIGKQKKKQTKWSYWMSKEIIRIIQNDEGGENPKTKLPEKPLW